MNSKYIVIPAEIFEKDKKHNAFKSSSHSNLIRYIFPDCKGSEGGADLPKLSENGFVGEIKESRLKNRMLITLHLKDLKEPDFLLFFYWKYMRLYYIPINKEEFEEKSIFMQTLDREKMGFGKKWILKNRTHYFQIRHKMKSLDLKHIRDFIHEKRGGNYEINQT